MSKSTKIVLDANEYIFGLGLKRKDACERLLEIIDVYQVRIVRRIADEVVGNLPKISHEIFYKLLNNVLREEIEIDENFIVPYELGKKYEIQGFKEADAFIAAYTERIGANYLITENRHFLSKEKELPFRVVTAEGFLDIIKEK